MSSGSSRVACRCSPRLLTISARQQVQVLPCVAEAVRSTKPQRVVDGPVALGVVTNRNSMTTYLRRYPDMPRPMVELGEGRVRLCCALRSNAGQGGLSDLGPVP